MPVFLGDDAPRLEDDAQRHSAQIADDQGDLRFSIVQDGRLGIDIIEHPFRVSGHGGAGYGRAVWRCNLHGGRTQAQFSRQSRRDRRQQAGNASDNGGCPCTNQSAPMAITSHTRSPVQIIGRNQLVRMSDRFSPVRLVPPPVEAWRCRFTRLAACRAPGTPC